MQEDEPRMSKAKIETKKETLLFEDLAMLSIGALGLSVSIFTNFLGNLSLLIFLATCAVIPLVTYDILRITFNFHPLTSLKKFRKDNRALAWLWIVGFVLTIPMTALVYFVLDYPFDIIATYVEGTVTFTGAMAYAWATTHFIISYLLGFVLIFATLWVIINSKSPQGVY